jgi:ORF6N domain
VLDRDLAELYDVETRRLNEQVKRNIDKFPSDFMFQLSNEELEILMSQNATSSWGGIRKLPNVFTEHGVLMLSSVLSSARATQVNIQIMRIYTQLREVLLTNSEILLKLEKLDKKIINLGFDVKMHVGEIETIFELLKEVLATKSKPPQPRTPIGFETQATKNNNPEASIKKTKKK